MSEIYSDLNLNGLSIEPNKNTSESVFIGDIPLFVKKSGKWVINSIFLNCKEEKLSQKLSKIYISDDPDIFKKKNIWK